MYFYLQFIAIYNNCLIAFAETICLDNSSCYILFTTLGSWLLIIILILYFDYWYLGLFFVMTFMYHFFAKNSLTIVQLLNFE